MINNKKKALTREDFANCCHFCHFRHGGCGKSNEEILKTYDTKICDQFIPGKCYYCVVEQIGDQETADKVCFDAIYPSGCYNFKEGYNYEYFEELLKNSDFMEHEPNEHKDLEFIAIQEKRKAIKRIIKTRKYNKKLKRKAKENRYIRGPYFSDKKNRVLIGYRGKRSKYLKRQSNRVLRNLAINENSTQLKGSSYRKFFDYWWELD